LKIDPIKEPEKMLKVAKNQQEIFRNYIRSEITNDERIIDNLITGPLFFEGRGEGKNQDNALYNHEIEKIMKPYKKYGFQGAITVDKLSDLTPKKRMSFIMNLDKSTQPGSHWVAVNIDALNDKSVEYYDSFAEEPPESFMRDLKDLIRKIKPDTYLKMKINRIKEQDNDLSICGWHFMKFFLNRYRGIDFKEATPYSDVKKAEKDALKLRDKYRKFGFI
jgi:hypothetical protein